MKHILTQIFVTLGALFLVLILVCVYMWVADPYNLKPVLFGTGPVPVGQKRVTETSSVQKIRTATTTTVTKASSGFTLSSAQRQALIGLGIDPASVPTAVTAEQEACFVGVLGAPRVLEVKSGAVPSALEFFKAKVCL